MFKYLVRTKREHDTLPSRATLSTRFPDLDFPRVRDTEMPLLISQLRTRKKFTTVLGLLHKTADQLTEYEKADEAVQWLQGQLNAMAFNSNEKNHIVDVFSRENSLAMRKEMRKRATSKGGIMTGLKKLDTATNGLHPQQMVTVMSRSGVGKSWLSLILVKQAVMQGKSVILYPLEMGMYETATRLYTIFSADMNGQRGVLKNFDVLGGKVDRRKMVRLMNALEDRFPGQLHVADVGSLNDPYTTERIEAEVDAYKPDMFWVDYITLLKVPPSNRQDNEATGIKRLAHGIKDTAMRKNTVGGCSAQVNREGTKSIGKLPRLEHISFGDAIGHYCIPPETLVLTDDGYRQVSKLVDQEFKADDGFALKKAIAFPVGSRKLTRVWFRGQSFSCSPDHKILVYDNKEGDYNWKHAQDIQPAQDYLLRLERLVPGGSVEMPVVPQPYHSRQQIHPPYKTSAELGWLIGALVGDGYSSGKGEVTMCCGLDREFAEQSVRIVRELFGLKGSVRTIPISAQLHIPEPLSGYKLQYVAKWYNKNFEKWVRDTLYEGNQKRISPEQFEMSYEHRLGVWSGLLQSDGTVCNRAVRFVNSNRDVIDGFVRISESIGVPLTSVSLKKARAVQLICGKDGWTVMCNTFNAVRVKPVLFGDKLTDWDGLIASGAGVQRHGTVPSTYARQLGQQAFDRGERDIYIKAARFKGKMSPATADRMNLDLAGFGFCAVDRVENTCEEVDMYDVKVLDSEDKRIITNGTVTHNSDLVIAMARPEAGSSTYYGLVKNRTGPEVEATRLHVQFNRGVMSEESDTDDEG